MQPIDIPAPQTAPAPRTAASGPARPRVTGVAAVLQIVGAGLAVLTGTVAVALGGIAVSVFTKAGIEVSASNLAGEQASHALVLAVVLLAASLTYAAGLAILASFNLAGRTWARIATWALTGLYPMWAALGTLGMVYLTSPNFVITEGIGEALNDMIRQTMPGWLAPLLITSTTLAVLACLTAAVLLALPASNGYFAARAGGWRARASLESRH